MKKFHLAWAVIAAFAALVLWVIVVYFDTVGIAIAVLCVVGLLIWAIYTLAQHYDWWYL